MNRFGAGLVAFLVGAQLAGPVLAQTSKNICLQRNRVRSWHAFDDSTIIYTDLQRNQYTVTLRNSCRGLTNGTATLVYPRANSLSCIRRGDAVAVKAVGIAGDTCRVDSVQAGAPNQATGTAQAPEHEVDSKGAG